MWEAPPVVGSGERVGRRIFNDRLRGSEGQPEPPSGNLDWFIDTKSDGLSVDRTGQGVFKAAHRSYLKVRAEAHSAKMHGSPLFTGWACFDVSLLRKSWNGRVSDIKASPLVGDGLEENLFHADIYMPTSLTGTPKELALYKALYLRDRWLVEKIFEPSVLVPQSS